MTRSRRPRAALVFVGALASATAAGGSEITENEFLSLLTDDHPALVVHAGELAAAEGARQSPTIENPGLGFEREAPRDAAAQSTLQLSWRPPLEGRSGLIGDAAEAGLAAAEKRYEWERLRVRSRVRELFAQWAFASDRRDLFVDLTERTRRLAERALARASSGEESGLSARRLALAAAEATSALAGSEAEVLRVEVRLRALFPDLGSEVRPVRPALRPAPSEVAASDRPDVTAGELDVERADALRRLSGRYVEFPTLVGGWTVLEEEGGDKAGPVMGFEWNVPVFDRRQGERAQARRDAKIARARLELVRARAAAELTVARVTYEQLRTAADEVVEMTSGTHVVIDAATAEFQAGEATLTDLLETIRSVTDSRLAALELHQQALSAHRQLELSVGRPLTEGETR